MVDGLCGVFVTVSAGGSWCSWFGEGVYWDLCGLFSTVVLVMPELVIGGKQVLANFQRCSFFSINHVLEYWGDAFHWCAHLFWIFVLSNWHVKAILISWVALGGFLAWLALPIAALFVCSSAFSLGGKSVWPVTHWIQRSMAPQVLAVRLQPSLLASWKSVVFCSLSCFWCSFSTALWIWSRRWWDSFGDWLLNTWITAWLLSPMSVVFVS